MLWIAVRRLVSPGVPIQQKAIETMINTHFAKGPTRYPFEVQVALYADQSGSGQFKALRGNLTRISPEEPDHALLIHIANRITEGADEEELTSLVMS